MDQTYARELLARERARIEGELAGLREPPTDDEPTHAGQDPADTASEQFEREFDETQAIRLQDELDAIERAEQRLEQGTYGQSVESGEPIPNGRLELIPWAERTAVEQSRYELGG